MVENLPWTIAVVEDDPSTRRSIERLLNVCGFSTKGYSSAEDFLTRHDAGKIDCLLLDVDLGGMTGIALQRQLQATGSNLPVIFITALEDDALKAEAIQAGCIAYLQKPFPAALLIQAIADARAASAHRTS